MNQDIDERRIEIEEQRALAQRVIAEELGSIGAANSQAMRDATARYVDTVLNRCDKALENDIRMPQRLNADERYSAMKTLTSIKPLLKRLEQTIDDAQELIANAAGVDLTSAIANNNALLMESIGPIARITVGEAKLSIQDYFDEVANTGQTNNEIEQEALEPINALVREAFIETYGDSALIDTESAQLMDEQLGDEKRADEAMNRALASVGKYYQEAAKSAEGQYVFASMPSAFDGKVSAELKEARDSALLMRLVEEVRKSFAIYKRCLEDNGIFCAFPEHGRFGGVGSRSQGLCGYLGWSTGTNNRSRYQTRNVAPLPKAVRRVALIPDVIEDQCDDSLEDAIARMEKYNAHPYWGPLDEDPSVYIDHFWYGFKELMIFVNDMFEVELQDYVIYIEKMRNSLDSQASKIGFSMDAMQVEEAVEELGKLQRKLES